MRTLKPWVRCAFGNIYSIPTSLIMIVIWNPQRIMSVVAGLAMVVQQLVSPPRSKRRLSQRILRRRLPTPYSGTKYVFEVFEVFEVSFFCCFFVLDSIATTCLYHNDDYSNYLLITDLDLESPYHQQGESFDK